MNDLYSTLGVSRTATARQVRRAYRSLVKKWHPDRNRNGGAGVMFNKITRAYQILIDPESRSYYDQHGEAGLTARPMDLDDKASDGIMGVMLGRISK